MIWVISLSFLVLGVPLGVMLQAVVKKVKRYGKTPVLVIDTEGNIKDRWVKDPNYLRVGGKGARPALSSEYLHRYQGKPGYVLDEATGNPLRLTRDPERLREVATRLEEGWTWPDAFDNAIAYNDGRAKAVAMSQSDDKMNWAKFGAITGGVAVLLLVIILGLLFNFVRQSGAI